MSEVYVVIPAYNEGEVILQVIADLHKHNYHNIIVVNDGSDNNLEKLLRNEDVIYIKHLVNRGQGAALRTGTKLALKLGANYIVHFDADGQMQSQDICPMLENLKHQNIDVVLGSRFLDKTSKKRIPKFRRGILFFAKIFNRVFLRIIYTDPQNGFRVLNKNAAKVLNWKNDRMAHASEILYLIKKHKLQYKEEKVNIQYSKYSLKKGQSGKDAFKIVWDLFINRF